MADEDRRKIPFDKRVDPIGYAGELRKQYVDDLNTRLKLRLTGQGLDRVTGEAFEGVLSIGTDRSIDTLKFFRLYKRGKMTEEQFLSCISIQVGPAKKVVPEKQLDRMSTFTPATPRLTISRIKGVEVKLVDALTRLGEAVRGDNEKPLVVT